MFKVDRKSRTLSRLDKPSLEDAQILERTDLQEYIYNSSDDFFNEIGQRIFIVGKEVTPSESVMDRVDLLGIDPEGVAVIVELKRGSNKLQMLQAVSYAGMVERWGPEDFRTLISDTDWEKLTDFLEVDIEEINRRQRLLLISEGYDYALLAGAEWLSEQYGVDIRCFSVSLATDRATGAEYLACTGIFPPPELADQAVARQHARRSTRPLKWKNWDEALEQLENGVLKAFVQKELDAGRENYLRKRSIHFRLDGKRRWSLVCRARHAYVWQRGRFKDDINFWKSQLSDPKSVKPVKRDEALTFNLSTADDFSNFHEMANSGPKQGAWSKDNMVWDSNEDVY